MSSAAGAAAIAFAAACSRRRAAADRWWRCGPAGLVMVSLAESGFGHVRGGRIDEQGDHGDRSTAVWAAAGAGPAVRWTYGLSVGVGVVRGVRGVRVCVGD
ncbi:MAG: hypothetical protein ACRDQA_25885 [Nocardioidaceae bacterium]